MSYTNIFLGAASTLLVINMMVCDINQTHQRAIPKENNDADLGNHPGSSDTPNEHEASYRVVNEVIFSGSVNEHTRDGHLVTWNSKDVLTLGKFETEDGAMNRDQVSALLTFATEHKDRKQELLTQLVANLTSHEMMGGHDMAQAQLQSDLGKKMFDMHRQNLAASMTAVKTAFPNAKIYVEYANMSLCLSPNDGVCSNNNTTILFDYRTLKPNQFLPPPTPDTPHGPS